MYRIEVENNSAVRSFRDLNNQSDSGFSNRLTYNTLLSHLSNLGRKELLLGKDTSIGIIFVASVEKSRNLC